MFYGRNMSPRNQLKYPPDPVPLSQAARCLRVPSRWLRSEIEVGRLPALIADTAILVDVETVAGLLAERAKVVGAKAVSHG